MADPRDRFDDPDAPPSEQERAHAEELRAALEDPGRASTDAELARALSSAWDPRDLSHEQHATLVQRALTLRVQARRGARVVRIGFGAGALVALAASVLLVLWTPDRNRASSGLAHLPLAVSRSTQELFDQQFAVSGGERARVDRIAMARATDLRDNEFTKWGVR